MIKRIVLSAAFGMGNVGDEAICEMAVADIQTVYPDAEVTVLAWDIAQWKKSHPALLKMSSVRVLPALFLFSQLRSISVIVKLPLSLWAIARCDVFVWGGGGLIRNKPVWLRAYLRGFRAANFFRKRIFVLSVGIDQITDRNVKNLVKALDTAERISVRDKESKAELDALLPSRAKDTVVISDGVFHFPSLQHTPTNIHIIGLNLCAPNAEHSFQPAFLSFLESLATVFNTFSSKQSFVLKLLPTDKRDMRSLCILQDLCPTISCNECTIDAPHEYLRELQQCTIFLGMRLHSLILASRVCELPFGGFYYSDKVRHFTRATHIEHLFQEPLAFDPIACERLVTSLFLGEIPIPSFKIVEEDSLRQREFISGL